MSSLLSGCLAGCLAVLAQILFLLFSFKANPTNCSWRTHKLGNNTELACAVQSWHGIH